MSSFKLSYFDARGVAETTRYLLAVSKTEYEDKRYPKTFGTPGDWSTMERPEFDAAKADGTLAASLNRLPMLECDGAAIGQSKAIERFVATKVGLMGADGVEAAKIDAHCENVRDCKDDYKAAKKEGDEGLAKFFAEKMSARRRASSIFFSRSDRGRLQARVHEEDRRDRRRRRLPGPAPARGLCASPSPRVHAPR